MKYKGFEGSIEELVNIKLDDIEREENVTILHAIESGSRAWGFESPDSDYDVRFIYIRKKEFYLRVDDTKDYIDWELDEVLDINGWDITKALRLFYKSNGTLFEWANSPIVYRTTDMWTQIYNTAMNYYDKKACMYHYFGTAKSNYLEFLQDDYVKYKKYFYVIRPLLACQWIDERGTPAPVLFDTLKEQMLNDAMKSKVNKLLEMKIKMSEADKGKRIDPINQFIQERLGYYEQTLKEMEGNRNLNWESLNTIFLKALG